MASLNILMQNFYKVTQGNHEKVASFARRLEGTLNQIRLQWPGRVTDVEVQQHLKDHLFHGVCKHIRDSIRYLYSSLRTIYSQLMIAICKVERENEEACDKVRARSALTTDPVEGTTELGYHIAKLLVVLTRAGQDNQPSPAPQIAPDKEAVGRDGWTGALLVATAPITARLVWDRLLQSTAQLPAAAQGLQ